MSTPVQRLVEDALAKRGRADLLGAFVAAARLAAAARDCRDGLLDMPLLFHTAGVLGFDADALVEDSAELLTQREEEFLRAFAARADRDDIAAMGWSVAGSGAFDHELPA